MTSSELAVPPKCLKRLFKELHGLENDLPSDPHCSIWLRFDDETPQYIRALITGPLPGPTPYSGGVFAFDIYIPNDYPHTNPKVQLLTTGGGRVRFGPNLYADGKVCLSLLGTWSGPKWNSKHSSLYQVLISIQGLILGVGKWFVCCTVLLVSFVMIRLCAILLFFCLAMFRIILTHVMFILHVFASMHIRTSLLP